MNKIGWKRIFTRWCLQTYSTRFSYCSTKTAESGGEISQIKDEPSLPEVDLCCGDNCANCIWLDYMKKVKTHYQHDSKKMREAMNSIPNPELRVFVEMELKNWEEENKS